MIPFSVVFSVSLFLAFPNGVSVNKVLYISGAGFGPSFTNQEQQTPRKPGSTENTENKTGRKSNSSPIRKNYFLGQTPDLPAQKGPLTKKPISIVPKPFIPIGALGQVSPPSDEKKISRPQPDSERSPKQSKDLPDFSTDPFDTLFNQNPEDSSESPSRTGSPSDPRDPLNRKPFEVSALADIDPSILSISDPATNPVKIIDGTNQPAMNTDRETPDIPENFFNSASDGIHFTSDRNKVINAFEAFSASADKGSISPILDQFYRELLRTALPIAPAVDTKEQSDLIKARLSLAARLGDEKAYRAILALVEGSDISDDLARATTDQYLLDTRVLDACAIAENKRQEDNDSYWVYLAAFCAATNGDRIGVDFQFSILEELNNVDNSFYALMDQVLLEAESAKAGRDAPPKAPLSSPLVIRPLDVAMARLANSKIDAVSFSGQHPLSLLQALSLPLLSDNARANLVGQALKLGLIGPDRLIQFFKTVSPGLDLPPEDAPLDNFLIDAALGRAALIGEDAVTRVNAAAHLWRRSLKLGTAPLIALTLNKGLEDLPVLAKYGADLSSLIRIALMAGNDQHAHQLFTTFRSTSAGNDLRMDQALLDILPLAVATGLADPALLTVDRLRDLVISKGLANSITLLTLMESLGVAIINDKQWTAVSSPSRLENGSINPVLWRNFLIAVSRSDHLLALERLESLLKALKSGKPDPAVLGSLSDGLNSLGLKTLSKYLMREQLISRGL